MLLLGGLLIKSASAQSDTCKQRYVKTPTGYLMVLREGDNVFAEIEKLAVREKVPAASFFGLGFAGSAIFGFYDFNKKKFNPKEFKRVEMGSLTGSIAWSEGRPSLHMHGVATDEKFQAFGGHLLSLAVGTGSMEITVMVHDQKRERKVEQPLNANVLQLPSCEGAR
ncbi:DNA-binding protein [Filimonas effusa]|uniref:DNA-binding protein n=2 Tax=Filimonas effusa TaxID=2508721 RepID=A0A4Q1D296_9BACT|nr:DNA-binding protein [Filimonas effusa]